MENMKNKLALFFMTVVLLTVGCTSIEVKPSRYLTENSWIASQYIDLDGQKIHYLEAGNPNAPVILFVHGWLCSGGMWDEQMVRLKDSYHIYAIDLLGHGLSQRFDDEKNYTTESQSEMVIKFITKLNLTKVNIVGHSMGGETSARVTAKRPDLINKMVLIDAIGMDYTINNAPLMAKILDKLGLKGMTASMLNHETIYAGFRRYMYDYHNDIDQTVIDQVWYFNLRPEGSSANALKITNAGLYEKPITDLVVDINQPTLLIWGANDQAVPAKLGEEYHKRIKNSHLIVIDQAGHMVIGEHPARVSSEIDRFLKY